jgi:hypothetical protein
MYYPVEGGGVEVINICGYDYKCNVPPIGYGKNVMTGELEYVGIIKRSVNTKEQKWERIKLPKDWDKRLKVENERRKTDPEYFDPKLEDVRILHWRYRLCGVWVYINGKPTYITGSHFYYLNWCPIDIGFPHYRDTDRRFYYVWEYCVEDPACGGLVDVERRRMGKTYKMGSIILERTSRTPEHHAGIQSKTSKDAKGVFQKSVIKFFKRMPEFFRPTFDTTTGDGARSELRFFEANKRGKKAMISNANVEELESWIDWNSSDIFAYDGEKLGTYGRDEFGKTVETDVWEAWQVTRFCLDQDGEWVGKALFTSTIEEMESGGSAAKKLWDASDPNIRNENGQTKSGLYRIFFPAYETFWFDDYGMPRENDAIKFLMNQRDGLANDTRALSSFIRKNPFDITEAFRVDGDKCVFNPMLLNDRRDVLGSGQFTERGNFKWKDGERDTQVIWEPNPMGRWEICWNFEKVEQTNAIEKRGGAFYPRNKLKFIVGIDPFDHQITEDGRRSNGGITVLKRYDPTIPDDDSFNRNFVCKYKYRPSSPQIFYEDCLMTCVYFGAPMLFENNKPGISFYFEARGYFNFMVWLDGREKPGIAGSPQVIQHISEITDDFIDSSINKVCFIDMIDDWLEFDPAHTTKSDVAMSAGYALIGDSIRMERRSSEDFYDVSDLFPGVADANKSMESFW